MVFRKTFLILPIILLPLFYLLWFIHFHGFISYDDGWFLYDGLRLLRGEHIYKDFHYLYNPGSLYINAIAFKLFGVSIFASRIMAFLNSVLSILLLYLISKKIALHPLVICLLIFSYIFWGPAHINFVWPVMFCLTFALACGTLFLYSEKINQNLVLFLIGILSATIFILKQNFGLAIFIANIIFFLYKKEYRNLPSFLWYGIGYTIIILLQIGYFISTESLNAYIADFYNYTIVKIFQHGILNSALPWQYPSPLFIKGAKLLLYLSPVVASVLTIVKLVREKTPSVLFYFPLIALSYYVLSIRPTTDFIHLAPLIAIALIPLFIMYHLIKEPKQKTVLLLILIACFFAGMYSAFFRNYYRWNTPLLKQKTYLAQDKLKIFTDEKEKESITQIINYYDKHAKGEKYTFIYYFTPIYYLLLNKENPTAYDDLQLGGVSQKDQQKIIAILNQKKVNHVITDLDIRRDTSLIGLFIKSNFRKDKEINEYTMWQRK